MAKDESELEAGLADGEERARRKQSLANFVAGAGRGADMGALSALIRLSARAGERDIPQSLLLEGGTEEARLNAAWYWAALLNCRIKGPDGRPCLECADCSRLLGGAHRDIFFFDGRSESIKIDAVREMRAVLGEEPREALYRVVIFCEAQALGEAAANALLKSLEEPRPHTSFVLLAPQRERLLPTLVSRSWILTLPWPGAREALSGPETAEAVEWAKALLTMAGSGGRGWMERTARKGSVNKRLALQFILLCRAGLVEALSGRQESKGATPLGQAFAALTPERQRMLDEIMAEGQESLEYTVNPALVMDWMATRMYFILQPPKRA